MSVSHGPPIAIVYFSETGTAHSLADRLRRKLLRLHFRATILDAEELAKVTSLLFTSSRDRERLIVIFLCATTGNGEIPRHARRLWRFMLRKKLTAQSCFGLEFSSFGLGDASYAKFNWAAKKVHKRMLQLGAVEICMRGEGDESASGGIEHAYSEWELTLCSSLLNLYPIPEGVDAIPDTVLLPPEFSVTVLSDLPPAPITDEAALLKSRVTSTVKLGTVGRNARTTPATHFQDTREFVLTIEGTISDHPELIPGATLLIYPQNDSAAVAALISSQNWDSIADLPLSVSPSVLRWATAKPLTLRSMLTYHLDFTSVPRATFFEVLCYFSNGDEQQEEKLRQFADTGNEEYTQDRYDYADRPRRSILECLMEFESVKIPVEYLLEVFGELRPRQFSIAGFQENKIELLIAIVKYRTMLKRIRQGVCTRYVSDLKVGDHLLYEISPPQAKTPSSDTPVLLIGPGTGVAPLRWLLMNRMKSSSTSLLVFGNRFRNADWYYKSNWKSIDNEIESTDENGIVTITGGNCTVHCCFSRDGNKVKYVQDVLSRQDISASVAQMLVKQNGYVWVCGSKGKMPRAVRNVIEAAIDRIPGYSGQAVVAELDRQGRYVEETW
ncbi:hypothetical protein V1512DRAFT_255723 [Lipomyces arxii]|uniref:uncharacterized protein n=1 Tax=Lipomyces arxii TaxID=56418 RepID=UPI0034CEBD16